jgi:hypothetical protein
MTVRVPGGTRRKPAHWIISGAMLNGFRPTFQNEHWIHEIMHYGFRTIARLIGCNVRLFTTK